jgi:glycosyltransferase involved in cell wall biosynthesis
MLTVAIPTFNRNHLLQDCVARLLPQLGGYELLIVDNASDVPVATTLDAWLAESGVTNVRIVRNPSNVGSGANILRCLELCRSKWLYCLGDDDLVADDCIKTIERAMQSHPDALYMSFSRSGMRRARTFTTEGLAEFADRLDDWSTFLFMSSSIVHADRLRSQLRWGYLYAYSWAPLQAILLKLLNRGGEVIFSDAVICREESLSDESWVPFPVAAGKMVLPELVDDERVRRRLARKLMSQPSLPSLIYWARAKGDGSGTVMASNRFFLELYIKRCLSYGSGPRLWLHRTIAFLVLRPRLLPTAVFGLIEKLAFRALGRPVPTARPMSNDRA